MKYLVTGADGFLGRHFLAELARSGLPTRAMLLPGLPEKPLPGNPQVVHADVLNPESLAEAVDQVTDIIHLAARVHILDDRAPDPDEAFFRVNVEGTRALLQAAAKAGVKRFLLMSSVAAMGDDQGEHGSRGPLGQASTPYGRSKLAAEQVMFDFASKHGIQAVALRPPIIYGPGAKGNVLRLLEAAHADRRLPFGRIANQRSMVYVGTVIDAALRAMQSPVSAGKTYIVCDTRPYGTAELYTEICRAMGKPPLLRNVPVWLLRAAAGIGDAVERILHRKMPVNSYVVKRIVGDLCFDGSKIQQELDWSPKVPLEEGISKTVQWYRQGCPPTPPA
jgi:nucleoside-diphosphate-sugar epimerase